MNKDRNYAADLLDKLITLDKEVTSAYYEMGQILYSFRNNQLFETLGYSSFKSMVEEELSFSATTAHKYADTFAHYRRLHYNKREALDLIETFGYTNMYKVLPTMNDKVGKRAIKNRIDNSATVQINFMLTQDEVAEYEEAYQAMGGTYSETAHKRLDASDLFMEMVREVKALHSKGKAA